MGMAERIKQRRLALGFTQEELASRLGLQKSAIAKYENGRVENIKRTVIQKMADVLECSPSYLMGWASDDSDILPSYTNIHPIAKQSLPVLGEIACGKPQFMDEQIEFYTDKLEGIHADFVLIAHGDSMIGARIHDGDLVFIRKQEEVENGEIAAVAIGDEATLKRVFFYANKSVLVLRAENPDFKDMEYSGSELADVHVLGKAVAFQSVVK